MSAEADRPQKVGELVAAPLQLTVGQHFAAAGHDDSRLFRPQACMFARIHRAPCSLSGCFIAAI
jgi:hypothetical protein